MRSGDATCCVPGVFPVGVAIAALLLVPNLIWEAGHGWVSVHWFLHPPPSGTDETRPQYVANLILLTHVVAVPVAVAGVVSLVRNRVVRPLGLTVAGTVVAYFVLGGKSYYGLPSILFALAAGAIPFDRWATRRRLWAVGAAYVVVSLVLLPITLPVLPLKTAEAHGVIGRRADYGDEIGWPAFVRTVERHAAGSDVVIVSNYGEAGALEVFGRNLPPVASGAVTFRFWRPERTGRKAVLVGYDRQSASAFCQHYRLVARISMPVANDERNQPVARCTLSGSLADVWPTIVGQFPV
ncbi:MAG: hypothetical protein ACXVRZ_09845 [Gaiellaceae bacterium]